MTRNCEGSHKNLNVVFLVDLSGSYRDDIATFKNKSQEIIDAIKQSLPEYLIKIGITSFVDFPEGGYGNSSDYAFRKNLDLTDDINKFKNVLNSLRVLNGGDEPESQLEGLYQTIKQMSWDKNSQKIILLFTDASFHDKDKYSVDKKYPGIGSNKLNELTNKEGLYIFGFGSGKLPADLVNISDFSTKLSSNSKEIVDKILEKLEVFSIKSRNFTPINKTIYSKDEFLGDTN